MKNKSILILLLLLLVAACDNRVSRANYHQIKPAMPVSGLVALLGEPDRLVDVSLRGHSGQLAIWSANRTVIVVELADNRVVAKQLFKGVGVDWLVDQLAD